MTHGRRVITFGSARQRSHDLPETKCNWVQYSLYSSRCTIKIHMSKCSCRLVYPLVVPFSTVISYKKGQLKLSLPGQVNRKWLQVVLGHARRNRDVTEVPFHPHSLVVVSTWRRGHCDIFVLHTSTGQRYLAFQVDGEKKHFFIFQKGQSLF